VTDVIHPDIYGDSCGGVVARITRSSQQTYLASVPELYEALRTTVMHCNDPRLLPALRRLLRVIRIVVSFVHIYIGCSFQ
jgi:hypothetical protein